MVARIYERKREMLIFFSNWWFVGWVDSSCKQGVDKELKDKKEKYLRLKTKKEKEEEKEKERK